MFELFMYVYLCNALSARFFDVDRALNSYFMIMIMITHRRSARFPNLESDSEFQCSLDSSEILFAFYHCDAVL